MSISNNELEAPEEGPEQEHLCISGVPTHISAGIDWGAIDAAISTCRLVIIHDVDADGYAAAWCIKTYLEKRYSSVLTIPQEAGVNHIPPELLTGDVVYMVDRSYPWHILKEMATRVDVVYVLDHHKSAMESYRQHPDLNSDEADKQEYTVDIDNNVIYFKASWKNIVVEFDLNKSACGMAHYHCLHNFGIRVPERAPWFVEYIQDRDLWKFLLANSREINAGIHYYGFSFDQLDNYNRDVLWLNKLNEVGTVALEVKTSLCKLIAESSALYYHETNTEVLRSNVVLTDEKLKLAIVPCSFVLTSMLGDYILNNKVNDNDPPYAVIIYEQQGDGTYKYSLRSKSDVLWIAEAFKGGGHPNACGFLEKRGPQWLFPNTANR